MGLRALLQAGDVEGCRKFWRKHAPHLPQPKTFEDAEITMHVARTASETCPKRERLYSHRWLTERNLPSQLPGDILPKIVEAVGISVNFHSTYLQPAALEVRTAMENAVLDRFAMDDKNPLVVQAAMAEARDKAMRALFGRR